MSNPTEVSRNVNLMLKASIEEAEKILLAIPQAGDIAIFEVFGREPVKCVISGRGMDDATGSSVRSDSPGIPSATGSAPTPTVRSALRSLSSREGAPGYEDNAVEPNIVSQSPVRPLEEDDEREKIRAEKERRREQRRRDRERKKREREEAQSREKEVSPEVDGTQKDSSNENAAIANLEEENAAHGRSKEPSKKRKSRSSSSRRRIRRRKPNKMSRSKSTDSVPKSADKSDNPSDASRKSKKNKNKKQVENTQPSDDAPESSSRRRLKIDVMPAKTGIRPLENGVNGVMIEMMAVVRPVNDPTPESQKQIELKVECPDFEPRRICVNGTWKNI